MLKTITRSLFCILLLLGMLSTFPDSLFLSTDANVERGVHNTRLGQVTLPSSRFSQGASMFPPLEWNKTYGGINDDGAQIVQQTHDGGYALAGYTCSYGSKTTTDCWLIKTDASGSLQWNMTYGGDGLDEAYSMIQTDDGGYALTGQTNSSGAGGFDFWLVKTDSQGKMQWNKTYGGLLDESAKSLVQTLDGYIIAGYTNSFAAMANDFWVVKIDTYGNVQWNRTYGGAGDDFAYWIQQTTDEGYIVAGSTNSFGRGAYDVWLAKIDPNGNQEWAYSYGGLQYDYGYSVMQTNDGGYLVAGATSSMGAGSYDFFLVKVDGSGTLQWNKTCGGVGSDLAFSAIQSKEGGFAVAGVTSSFGAQSDFWLVKTDVNGNMQWNATIGGADVDWARAVQQTVDGGYVIAGYTDSLGSGLYDAWLVRLASVDVVPPLTANDYDGLWHTTDFTIILTATDDFSGLASTYYEVNGNSIKNVSADGQPKITTESANNTLVYWSTDNAGHEESPKVLTEIKLDKTPPLGFITINNDHRYVNSTLVSLMLSATDATSGVYQARYSNDDFWDTEAWETFSSTRPWTLLSNNGNKTVYYQIMDKARLVSGTISHSIFLDTSPPEASLINPTNAESFSTSAVVFSASAIDSESGITNVELYVDDQFKGNMTLTSEDTYILTVSALSNSNHTWFARAQNGAGSVATSQTRSFTIQTSGRPDYALLFYLIVALAVASILALTSYIVKRKKRQPQNYVRR